MLLDPFTRPSILSSDLVKRLIARRWACQMLGVKGSQVQILSARHDQGPLKQGIFPAQRPFPLSHSIVKFLLTDAALGTI